MAHLLGTAYVDRFTLIDSEGAYVAGETFTADQVWGPGGLDFDWTVTELGSGLYSLAYDLDLVGTYYLRLVTDTLDPFQIYESQVATDEIETGATATHYFTVRDADGNYYGGAGVVVDAAYDPSGDVFVPIIDDLDNGLYRVTWTLDLAGTYTLRLVASLPDTGDEDQVFEFETRVLAVDEVTISPFASVAGPSLDDLVRAVARKCRDYMPLRATDNAPDANTWRADLDLAARPAKTFKGADLFVTAAGVDDNIGRTVRVLDSVDGALAMTPALPAAPRRGDKAYLVNLESAGFVREVYVETINDTIEDIFPNALQPATWTFTDLFDADYPFLVPPDEFTHITAIIIPDGGWSRGEIHVPIGSTTSAGWYWDGSRIVLVGEGYRQAAAGTYITILGFGAWPRLESDADKTGVDRQWITEQAAGTLILSLRDPRRQAEAAMHLNRADGYLPKALTMLPANTFRIR